MTSDASGAANARQGDSAQGELRPAPELSRRLTDLRPPVLVGTASWLIMLAVLLVQRLNENGPTSVWLWTAVAGVSLGFIGLGIIQWQKRAARRGDRTAQHTILPS